MEAEGAGAADVSEFGLLCLHYYYSLWVAISLFLVQFGTHGNTESKFIKSSQH